MTSPIGRIGSPGQARHDPQAGPAGMNPVSPDASAAGLAHGLEPRPPSATGRVAAPRQPLEQGIGSPLLQYIDPALLQLDRERSPAESLADLDFGFPDPDVPALHLGPALLPIDAPPAPAEPVPAESSNAARIRSLKEFLDGAPAEVRATKKSMYTALLAHAPNEDDDNLRFLANGIDRSAASEIRAEAQFTPSERELEHLSQCSQFLATLPLQDTRTPISRYRALKRQNQRRPADDAWSPEVMRRAAGQPRRLAAARVDNEPEFNPGTPFTRAARDFLSQAPAEVNQTQESRYLALRARNRLQPNAEDRWPDASLCRAAGNLRGKRARELGMRPEFRDDKDGKLRLAELRRILDEELDVAGLSPTERYRRLHRYLLQQADAVDFPDNIRREAAGNVSTYTASTVRHEPEFRADSPPTVAAKAVLDALGISDGTPREKARALLRHNRDQRAGDPWRRATLCRAIGPSGPKAIVTVRAEPEFKQVPED